MKDTILNIPLNLNQVAMANFIFMKIQEIKKDGCLQIAEDWGMIKLYLAIKSRKTFPDK